jgi:hypothetical protein
MDSTPIHPLVMIAHDDPARKTCLDADSELRSNNCLKSIGLPKSSSSTSQPLYPIHLECSDRKLLAQFLCLW